MKYARLGDSGLIVSQLAYGASNIGTPLPMFAATPHLSEAQAREAVSIALDNGVNFFDTADLYSNGEAEEILGRALSARRQDVVISTKVGMRFGEAITRSGLSRRHILNSVDGSLRRLNCEWIDVYIAHRPDPHTPLEETLEALDHTVRCGKVRYLGYSNWPDWMAAKAVGLQREHGWARFVTGQMHYSLLGREVEFGTIPFFLDAGIGMMVWSPLSGGFLSGKYTRDNPGGSGGRLSRFSFGPLDTRQGFAVVDVLKGIAAKHAVSPANVALAWLMERSTVSTVLIGISHAEMLRENLYAAAVALTADDRKALDEVSRIPEPYPHWFINVMDDTPTRKALKR